VSRDIVYALTVGVVGDVDGPGGDRAS